MKSPEFFIEKANGLIKELNYYVKDGVEYDFDNIRLAYMKIKAMFGEFDNGKPFLEALTDITDSSGLRFNAWNEGERLTLCVNVLLAFIDHVATYRTVDPTEVANPN
jgi:hypothetical protein